MAEDTPIVVIGGGLVGGTLALLLAEAGWSVRIIEARDAPLGQAPAEDPERVSALSPASRRILEAVEAWPDASEASGDPGQISPYRCMRVWDAHSRGEITFRAEAIDQPELGYIVANRRVIETLETRLATVSDRVTWHRPAQVEALTPQPDPRADGTEADCDAADPERVGRSGWTVHLSTGERLRTDWVIAADGGDSRIRRLAGIDVVRYKGDQQAIVATVETTRPHAATAWQRFLKTGPIACLPLAGPSPEDAAAGRISSIVWSTTPAEAERLLQLSEQDFGDAVAEALGYRLGGVYLRSRRARFPLQRQHAKRYVLPGIALVGDAAHRIHPLAGQGVNLGLLDAATLVEVARADPKRRAQYTTLKRYERWRRGENALMLESLEGLAWLFGQSSTAVRWTRGLGLRASDRCPRAKRTFMERAMGLAGDLPSLARATDTFDA